MRLGEVGGVHSTGTGCGTSSREGRLCRGRIRARPSQQFGARIAETGLEVAHDDVLLVELSLLQRRRRLIDTGGEQYVR